MKYVMLIICPETDWAQDRDPEQTKQVMDWMADQSSAGAIDFPGYRLDGPATARTLRPGPDSTAIVTDGPFVESREVIGGVVVLEHDNVDDAVKAASEWVRINPAWAIEVRPAVA